VDARDRYFRAAIAYRRVGRAVGLSVFLGIFGGIMTSAVPPIRHTGYGSWVADLTGHHIEYVFAVLFISILPMAAPVPQYRRRIRILIEQADAHSIGYLLDFLIAYGRTGQSADLQALACQALTTQLDLTDVDAAQTTMAACRGKLLRIVKLYPIRYYGAPVDSDIADLVCAILRLWSKSCDMASLRCTEGLAANSRGIADKVVKAVNERLPLMRERLGLLTGNAATLVRPAEAPDGDSLLRAAGSGDLRKTEHLLHVVDDCSMLQAQSAAVEQHGR